MNFIEFLNHPDFFFLNIWRVPSVIFMGWSFWRNASTKKCLAGRLRCGCGQSKLWILAVHQLVIKHGNGQWPICRWRTPHSDHNSAGFPVLYVLIHLNTKGYLTGKKQFKVRVRIGGHTHTTGWTCQLSTRYVRRSSGWEVLAIFVANPW